MQTVYIIYYAHISAYDLVNNIDPNGFTSWEAAAQYLYSIGYTAMQEEIFCNYANDISATIKKVYVQKDVGSGKEET